MSRNWLVSCVAVVALAGCGGGSSDKKDPDSSILIYLDSGFQDAELDAAVVDAARFDAAPRPDAAVIPLDGGNNLTGTCAAPIDLNTAGTTAGGITSISGNNGGAPADAPTDVVGPSCATDMNGNHASYAVAFSYTMQTTANLRANTAVTGTASTFDSIVWIVNECGSSGMQLGCNDEALRNDSRSTAFTPMQIASGTTVRIIVAGYTPPNGTNRAPFKLEVSELQPNAANAQCDSLNPLCVSGYTCIYTPPSVGSCLADGSLNGACRTSGTACDGTMRCSVDAPTAGNRGVCQEPLPVGTACTSTMYVCVAGAHCTQDPGANTFTCRTDMAEGGMCSLTMPYCNTGLKCSRDMPTSFRPGVCAVPLPAGSVCSTQTSACIDGYHCVRDTSTANHCVQDGTLGGRCLSGGTCNSGLTCTNNTCQ